MVNEIKENFNNAPKAENILVVEMPSWRRDCLSSFDMDVYASESTNRMAGERCSSYQFQLNSIKKRTSEEITLPGAIPPDYDIMFR